MLHADRSRNMAYPRRYFDCMSRGDDRHGELFLLLVLVARLRVYCVVVTSLSCVLYQVFTMFGREADQGQDTQVNR